MHPIEEQLRIAADTLRAEANELVLATKKAFTTPSGELCEVVQISEQRGLDWVEIMSIRIGDLLALSVYNGDKRQPLSPCFLDISDSLQDVLMAHAKICARFQPGEHTTGGHTFLLRADRLGALEPHSLFYQLLKPSEGAAPEDCLRLFFRDWVPATQDDTCRMTLELIASIVTVCCDER